MKTKTCFCLGVVLLLPVLITAQLPEFKTMLSEEWVKNAWRNESRITNDYDNKGKLIKQTSQGWDTIANHWDNITMETNEYDSNGKMTKKTTAGWDTISNKWMDMLISVITYNADGTIKENKTSVWDKDSKTWVDFTKLSYTYDAAKNVLTMTVQMDFGMGLMTFSKNTNTYNASNQMTKSLYQAINLMNMQLEDDSQLLLEYNTDGTEYRTTQQSWNVSSAKWENDSRSTKTYNSSKKVISDLEEEFTNGQWVNYQKETQTYDNQGNVAEMLTETWIVNSATWRYLSKEIITWSGGKMYQILSQDWDNAGNKWVNGARVTFEYGTTGIGQQWFTESLVNVFPNPFTGAINIKTNGLKNARFLIFSSEGKMVYSFAAQEPLNYVDLSFLHSGTYYLMVQAGEVHQTIRLIKTE